MAKTNTAGATAAPVTGAKPAPRGNRRSAVLDAAARAFALNGFAGASIRDIAADAGIRPSSLYYFFTSKEDLYEAVYERGVGRILDAVERKTLGEEGPWNRLEKAASAHLEALLADGDDNSLVAGIVPRGQGGLEDRLIPHRDRYERVFKDLIAALPLPRGTDRKLFRLTLLSALNGVAGWYRPGGLPPARIAARTVSFFRRQLEE
jgi:AcrR family transcriptional regulator